MGLRSFLGRQLFARSGRCRACLPLLALLLLFSPGLSAEPSPAAVQPKRILLLHSWAQGEIWPESINRGMREGLADGAEPIELFIENADINRLHSQDYPALADFIARKYAQLPPDLLIADDDQSTSFLTRYRQQLFPEKPLISASLRSLEQVQTIEHNSYQVLDALDEKGNIQLIHDVLPEIKTLVLVGNALSPEGQQQVRHVAEFARGVFPNVLDLTQATLEQLQVQLPGLPRDSAVFITPWIRNGQGQALNPVQSMPQVTALLRVPSFAAFEQAFAYGVTGGKMTSGEARGQALAKMARQLLAGQSQQVLPTQSVKQTIMFDYLALQRFGLAGRPLPQGTVLRNQPVPIYASNPQLFFGASAAILLLLAVVGFLMALMRVRHRTTGQLRDNEARYRLLFEQNPSPMLVYDTERLTCLAINRAFTQAFGYGVDELMGTPISVIIAPAQHAALLEAIRQASTDVDSKVLKTRWQAITASGAHCDVETSTQAIRFNERPARIVMLSDITEQVRAEVAQYNSEARLNQIIESSPVAMIVLDAEQRVTHWNFATERMVRIPAEVIVGKRHHLGRVFGKERRLLVEALMDGMTPEQMSEHAGVTVRRSEFSADVLEVDSYTPNIDRWLHTEATLLRDAEGQVCGAIQTMLDISAVRRATQQLTELNAELEARVATRTAELTRAMEQLVQSEKLAALGSLVAGVAHELNTPLGNVMTVVTTLSDRLASLRADVEGERLRRSQLSEFLTAGSEACAILERNTVRAAELVASFKQVAVDQTSSRRRCFRLLEAVQETLNTLLPLYKHQPVTISTEVAEELKLDSYPGPLEQVITNLLGNAVTHALGAREHLQIRIHAVAGHYQGQPSVLISISDDGVGMSAEVVRHAFEPFFTTRLGQGGSGLGLYVVYNLVTVVLGGQIELQSEPEQGTCFRLNIPLNAPANAAVEH